MRIFQAWEPLVAVLGVLATFYSVFGTPSRRLRRDLAVDAELLPTLSGTAAQDMRRSIHRRSFQVVAATRYPGIVLLEVLITLGMILVLVWLAGVPGELRELDKIGEAPLELMTGQVLAVVLLASLYISASRSWTRRAVKRIRYVRRRLGYNTTRQLTRTLNIAVWLYLLAFTVPTFVLLIYNSLAVSEVANIEQGWTALASAVLLALCVLFTGKNAGDGQLGMLIHRYRDERATHEDPAARATGEATRSSASLTQPPQPRRPALRQHGGRSSDKATPVQEQERS